MRLLYRSYYTTVITCNYLLSIMTHTYLSNWCIEHKINFHFSVSTRQYKKNYFVATGFLNKSALISNTEERNRN